MNGKFIFLGSWYDVELVDSPIKYSRNFDPLEAEIDQFVDLWYDTLERNNLLVENWSHILGETSNEGSSGS